MLAQDREPGAEPGVGPAGAAVGETKGLDGQVDGDLGGNRRWDRHGQRAASSGVGQGPGHGQSQGRAQGDAGVERVEPWPLPLTIPANDQGGNVDHGGAQAEAGQEPPHQQGGKRGPRGHQAAQGHGADEDRAHPARRQARDQLSGQQRSDEVPDKEAGLREPNQAVIQTHLVDKEGLQGARDGEHHATASADVGQERQGELAPLGDACSAAPGPSHAVAATFHALTSCPQLDPMRISSGSPMLTTTSKPPSRRRSTRRAAASGDSAESTVSRP